MMKNLILILSLLLIAGISYGQQGNRIDPADQLYTAPGANYILLSDVAGEFQIVPSNTLPGGGGGDIIQSVAYGGDTLTITTDNAVFNVNINAGTVETTAPISINGTVYPGGTDIQTILGGVGIAINNISLVDNGDGTYTFTDTDGTTVEINTGSGGSGAFYYYAGDNNSYSLPLDTLNKYDLLTIAVRHSIGISPTLTLPDFPDDSTYNGKTIVVHLEASEVLDTIFIEAAGASNLVQLNCYAFGKTTYRDSIMVQQERPRMIVYRTSYQDDYVRECEGYVTLNDGTVILPGDTLPNFSISLNNACECDTIYQAAHGFAAGDLLGQTAGNGPLIAANTASADNVPVFYVSEVLHTDTVVVKSEGWMMNWTHGQLVGRDYFLQDDGSLDTVPDADLSVFAFRTVTATRAYFDIPEYIATQADGGSGVDIAFSNGLNDADAGSNVDGELGGTLEKNTLVEGATFNLEWNNNTFFRIFNLQNEFRVLTDTLASRLGEFVVDPATSVLKNTHLGNDTRAFIGTHQDGQAYIGASNASGSTIDTRILFDNDYIQLTGVPNYANDAAADSDVNLPSGGIYTVTAEDRSLRIKP